MHALLLSLCNPQVSLSIFDSVCLCPCPGTVSSTPLFSFQYDFNVIIYLHSCHFSFKLSIKVGREWGEWSYSRRCVKDDRVDEQLGWCAERSHQLVAVGCRLCDWHCSLLICRWHETECSFVWKHTWCGENSWSSKKTFGKYLAEMFLWLYCLSSLPACLPVVLDSSPCSSVCLSVYMYLSACFVCLSVIVCLLVSLSVCPPACVSACLSV